MDDVRAAGPVRPNLWADRLTSYAFGVEATIGQNPMRYLVGRRFDDPRPAQALTMLFVLQPRVLFGTYVRISETARGGCEVHTFLPTMARPLRVAESLLFDCLPLTDVGYLDLMAWRHPGLRAMDAAAWPLGDDVEAPGPAPTMTLHYQGPRSMPELMAREVVDLDLSMVTRRVLYRAGRRVRQWEIIERGEAGQETLARRIRVSRPASGHETEFVRNGPAVAVPPDIFDQEPAELARSIESRLTHS